MTDSLLPSFVKVVEVGARDGLQNESKVTTEDKVTLIQNLVDAGVKHIEAGAFVSPKWVPQMADSKLVIESLNHNSAEFSALTPNLKGAHLAFEAGIKEFAIFTAASEAFCQKNINCSIDESIERFKEIMSFANEHNIKVRGYVSCVMGCPYQGDVEVSEVVRVSKMLLDMGCYEISLGDTVGVGTPGKTEALISSLLQEIPANKLAVHFHDTYGQALTNIYAALKLGIATVDAAVAGLGGCPYAKGASGNVATEDLIYMLDGLGIDTNIDIKRLSKAGWQISNALNKVPASKVSLAMQADLSE
ncbi:MULTISPECIES: hydroxymethylglutaryl-CoA lyase [unclassified Pseudoalteromonas]|uniref:hydroxymethylglutaryl-CoA lyase n=1 Tax=unclassified Pseudoalteromonas TaxID=194690 RepID=UPI0005A6F477|nr:MULTISPECIES: hydroxymethylglutaryl-CoA lyase [unclassified Pseudoalteromonas]